jgi:hypothetical protein
MAADFKIEAAHGMRGISVAMQDIRVGKLGESRETLSPAISTSMLACQTLMRIN